MYWIGWLLILAVVAMNVALGIRMYRQQIPWGSPKLTRLMLASAYANTIVVNLIILSIYANARLYRRDATILIILLFASIPAAFIVSYLIAQASCLCARRVHAVSRK